MIIFFSVTIHTYHWFCFHSFPLSYLPDSSDALLISSISKFPKVKCHWVMSTYQSGLPLSPELCQFLICEFQIQDTHGWKVLWVRRPLFSQEHCRVLMERKGQLSFKVIQTWPIINWKCGIMSFMNHFIFKGTFFKLWFHLCLRH